MHTSVYFCFCFEFSFTISLNHSNSRDKWVVVIRQRKLWWLVATKRLLYLQGLPTAKSEEKNCILQRGENNVVVIWRYNVPVN